MNQTYLNIHQLCLEIFQPSGRTNLTTILNHSHESGQTPATGIDSSISSLFCIHGYTIIHSSTRISWMFLTPLGNMPLIWLCWVYDTDIYIYVYKRSRTNSVLVEETLQFLDEQYRVYPIRISAPNRSTPSIFNSYYCAHRRIQVLRYGGVHFFRN